MHYDSIASIAERIRLKQVSPAQLLESCLARIEALGPRLNAFITLAPDSKDQAAQATGDISQGRWLGPMHGVPVAVKDFYDTAGLRTTAGSDQFQDRVPQSDAEVVRLLRQAGAIIVGKTNMDALGMATSGLTSSFGAVRNPWDQARVPGGSSAGSASAVAAGLCFAAVDTDAVGSARLPAACCGVVGFKGSYGLVSVQGILGDGPVDDFIRWMGHAAITARSALDVALVMDVLAPRQGASFTQCVLDWQDKLRLGVYRPQGADAGVLAALEAAVAALARAGHVLLEADVPSAGDGAGDLSAIARDRSEITAVAFADVDLLVLPTLAHGIPTVADALGNAEQAVPAEDTAFANYYGLPAISVPCGFDRHGMPVGLQVVGRPGHDDEVLAFAHHYETLARFPRRHPIA